MDDEEFPICRLCRKTYFQQCCCWIQLSIGSIFIILSIMVGLVTYETNQEQLSFIPALLFLIGFICVLTSSHKLPRYGSMNSETIIYD